MAVPGFLFGGDTGLTQEQLAQRRRVLEAMEARGVGAPRNVGEGLTALGEALAYRMQKNSLAKGEAANNEQRTSVMNTLLGGGSATTGEAAATAPYTTATAGTQTADIGDLTGNEVFGGFMDTVKAGGVENPYALAAIAATGKAESGFDPGNVNRTWSDPSESGKPGRAGGIMSWRGPRYEALQATGDLTPQGQAKFFLQEDPNLIQSLNGAKSVEEAQSMMNRAWAFKGYDRPGGEAARRMSLASSFLPKFQGGQAPQEVASLDPSIGMPPATAAQAIQTQAPQGAGSLSDEVADWKQTPEAQAQFPGRRAVAAAMQAKGMGQQAAQPSPAVQQVAGAMGAQLAPMPAPVDAAPPQAVAAPQQVAQAAPMPIPPQMPQQTGPSLQQLYQAASDPSLNDNDRAVVNSMIQQRQQQDQNAQQQQTWMQRQQYEQQAQRADPAYQLGIDYKRAQMEALTRKPEKAWARLDDNTLFNPETGETRAVPADPNRPASDLGLNPQYGVDANGNPVLLQLGKDGRTIQSQLPDGVTLSKEPIKLDAGTHFVLLDPITRQPVGQIPKENRQEAAEKAAGTVEGKSRAEAASGLSTAELVGNQITGQIDDILNDPNLGSAVGSIDGRLPSFRQGSVDFDKKLERLQGQAFLQAREFLKGQGPITDFESRKAEAASVQLSTAQSEEQFRQALKDFKDAVASGVQKARLSAGGGNAGPMPTNPAMAPPAGPNVDDLLRKYGPR